MDKFECLRQLVRARDLTPAQFRAVVGILNYADHWCGNAYPGTWKLAEDLGIDRRRVRRTIAELVAKGYLVVTHEGGSSKGGTREAAVYKVVIPGLEDDPGNKGPGVNTTPGQTQTEGHHDPRYQGSPRPPVPGVTTTPGLDGPGVNSAPDRGSTAPPTGGHHDPPNKVLTIPEHARASGVARVRAALRSTSGYQPPTVGSNRTGPPPPPPADVESLRAAAAAALAELRKEAS